MGLRRSLALCCALIHDPDLLILDEPTTGVDPLARAQFWDLISHLREARRGMSVIVATAYMDEAQRFDWLVAMVDSTDLATRRRVGYMSQAFSLYTELTVRQNLVLHARLFQVPETDIAKRVEEMVARFGLQDVPDALPDSLPLGIRQRLSLAVAMVHRPELLILDEPTSGVDPIARDRLWQLMIDLARNDKVTIFISTHFMNEAARCDRISLMHADKVLVTEVPAELVRLRAASSLEAAFISYLKAAEDNTNPPPPAGLKSVTAAAAKKVRAAPRKSFSLSRAWSYTLRETLELKRDPVRGTMALLGTAVLMLMFGYGINMDVENLNYAVLDRDQTGLSRNYALSLYVTPVTRTELLLVKQLPYIALGMINFFLLAVLAVTLFDVPVKGSFPALAVAAMLFVMFSTGFGLVASTFTVSIYIAATAMPETLHKAPIAIVDEDDSPLSARIGGAFYLPRFAPPALRWSGRNSSRWPPSARHFSPSS